MAKPDILLRDDRISVIGKGTSGIERGVLEVSVGEKKTPSIRMSADQANVTIGGGDGASTEGDLRLNDENGQTRIQLTADDGNRPTGEESVWVNGELGSIEIGGADGSAETGSITVLGSQEKHRVSISGSGRIEIGKYGVKLYRHSNSGVAEFKAGGNTGVEIQGASASIRVGYSYTRGGSQGDGDPGDLDDNNEPPSGESDAVQGIPTRGGQSGRIFLDDGNTGGLLRSTIFEVRATDGKIQILTGGQPGAKGSPIFEIDPWDEAIKVPKNWPTEFKNELPEFDSSI